MLRTLFVFQLDRNYTGITETVSYTFSANFNVRIMQKMQRNASSQPRALEIRNYSINVCNRLK